ncbi:MAG: hypothetical protein AAGK23_00710 [Pseudomonadota bacterium]
MNARIVERSIALWKAQNGPLRNLAASDFPKSSEPFAAYDIRPENPLYIDYTERRCDYV